MTNRSTGDFRPALEGLLGEDAVMELLAAENGYRESTKSWGVCREEYGAKYPKALAKLDRDWVELTAFYDYPAEHWRHLADVLAGVKFKDGIKVTDEDTDNDGRHTRCQIHDI